MVRIVSHSWSQDDDIGSELEELRAGALRYVLAATAALAVYVHFALSAFANRVDVTRFGFMWAVIVAVALAYWALRYGAVPASAVFVIALAGILAVAVLYFRQPTLGYWFSPLVIVAGVLLDWRGSVALAVGATAAILASVGVASAMSGDVATGSLLLTWVSLLSAWLLSHPTRTALGWAWHSYARTALIMEELRDHQGQLERTVKSLNVAYERLEQLNVELARARRAAEHARRLKSEFAAAISHELRTPLNLIIGFSEIMVMDPRAYDGQKLPDAYRGDIEAIYRNACHLSNLVDDVLDLSQIEADHMGLQKERTHLAPVIDEALSMVARLFSAKGLALHLEVPLDLPPMNADRTRIRQVLINLLNNAVRFTSSGGVTIRAWTEGADVIVAVTDTGIGIAAEHLSAVFEEFRQVHILGERRVVGSGLGLAVSKRFIELHGGSMWVESQLGSGSTFFFSVPSCENVIAASTSLTGAHVMEPPPGADAAEHTILVIDRLGESARLFRRHLDGFRVVVAASSEGARRIAHECAIQAAILVGSNGPPDWATVRRIGEMLDGVPVAACTLTTRKISARELGATDCLLKPIGRDQVRQVLRRLGRKVRTILVVDDDPEMVRLLGRLISLASRRYTVWEAQSGLEALALIDLKRPDAVFLDLVMPDLNGDELLRRIRSAPGLEGIPVVLVTGHGLENETVTAEFFGMTQTGGFSVRELMRCLRGSLEVVYRPQTTLVQHVEQGGSANRLGQEIGRTHGQGEGPLVNDRADGDGDILGRRIAFEGLEEVPAVAKGHHEVKRNEPRAPGPDVL